MIIYVTKKTSPFYTLAMEELLLKDESIKEDIMYFYQHDNAIIIGKNQNIYEEVKLDVVEKEKIEVYRRLSGGGAVYHDLGNINFSFITKKENNNYEKFLSPIIEFFQSLGLDARFKGRNDLVVNGAKVSGNAQIVYKNRMVHHGTILFDANLSKLSEVLIPNKLKIESKGIKSIRQRVTNILSELDFKMYHDEFIEKLISFFEKKYQSKRQELPSKYDKELKELGEFKKSKEWVYGKNPSFSFKIQAKTDGGILKILANIENNKIYDIAFEGDFLSQKPVEEIYHLFIDQEFSKANIGRILDSVELEHYFGAIKKEEIIALFFGELGGE
ncbi:lipoate--protein ligase [Mesomycoplasma hyorhinis]|uniref:lipoate--protein ligase n=1 Tax=Mesomycoplasma hyorhinis TaxID=2100 RepID=UPI001C03F150|nr:lipoate--protein ligase [Mesomycoplasma hyorhinis]